MSDRFLVLRAKFKSLSNSLKKTHELGERQQILDEVRTVIDEMEALIEGHQARLEKHLDNIWNELSAQGLRRIGIGHILRKSAPRRERVVN